MLDVRSNYLRILQNKLLKETFWSFATKGSGFFLFIALNVFLARSLGVERFGQWSFILSIITVTFLLSYLGINRSTRKYVAQYNKTDLLGSVLISSFRLRIVFSLLFSLILLALYKPLAAFMGWSGFETIFFYAIPLVFFSGFVEYFKDVFQGLHRLKYNFIITSLEYGLKLVLAIGFLSCWHSLTSIVNSFTLALLLTSIVGFYILYTRYYCRPAEPHRDFTSDIFRYSIPLIVISIGFLIATEVDTIMLGLLSTESEVGFYSVAKQVVVKFPHISLAIAMGAMPVFAKLNESNKTELKNLFSKMLRFNLLLLLVIVAGVLLLSGYLVPLVFGSEYSASVLPLQILTIYVVGNSMAILFGSFLDFQGLATKRGINIVATIVFNIVLNAVLIPVYGAVGAAIATSVSYLPYVFLNWLEVRKVFR